MGHCDDTSALHHLERENLKQLLTSECVERVELPGLPCGCEKNGDLTCSIAGDAFCVVASPLSSLLCKVPAAVLRVLRSGSDRQLMVRCRVATYCCTCSCVSPAAAGSYWAACICCCCAGGSEAVSCLLRKCPVPEAWCCGRLGSTRVCVCTPGMPKPEMPVVADLGTALARVCALSSFHISSTDFFLVTGSIQLPLYRGSQAQQHSCF
jgi:hypothetical protein